MSQRADDVNEQARHPVGDGAATTVTRDHTIGVWPSVVLHQERWRPSPDVPMSRTQRLKNTGTFTYADPAAIASTPLVLDAATQEAVRSATSLIERFDEKATAWGRPFASVLLRSESASSSQIEQLSASARRIALAGLGDTNSHNATSIANNVLAMQAAIALAESLSADAILSMHAELGGGDDPRNAGRFRREWVWIGGNSPVTAAYTATRFENVGPAIDDLIAFLRRHDVEPLTQAAIAHAQFETIHPFTDGNGRTGRALVAAVLRHRGVATNLSVPISSGLLSDMAAYIDALTRYRGGDPQPIVTLFAEASERAVANAAVLQSDVVDVREQILATAERKTANITRMADLCSSEPAFNIDMVVAAGVTRPTAYRLCERLTTQGLLRRERAIRGQDAWTVVALTDALDAFAERAGRRSFYHQ